MEIKKINEDFEYKLVEKILDRFANATNRSNKQTAELFELVDKDLMKLIELEEKIKNNHITYAPGNKEDVEKILQLGYGEHWWKIEFVATYRKEPHLVGKKYL